MASLLQFSPDELAQAYTQANGANDLEQSRAIIKEVNDALIPVVKALREGSLIKQGFVRLKGNYSRQQIDRAVEALRREGYKVKSTHDDGCDDGPNRSSPPSDNIIIDFI